MDAEFNYMREKQNKRYRFSPNFSFNIFILQIYASGWLLKLFELKIEKHDIFLLVIREGCSGTKRSHPCSSWSSCWKNCLCFKCKFLLCFSWHIFFTCDSEKFSFKERWHSGIVNVLYCCIRGRRFNPPLPSCFD